MRPPAQVNTVHLYSVSSVSYTHLDVYKRQHNGSAPLLSSNHGIPPYCCFSIIPQIYDLLGDKITVGEVCCIDPSHLLQKTGCQENFGIFPVLTAHMLRVDVVHHPLFLSYSRTVPEPLPQFHSRVWRL